MRFVTLSRSRRRPVQLASFAAALLALLAVVLMPLLHSAGNRGAPSPDTSGVHAHVVAIHEMHGAASAADDAVDGPGGATADVLGCLDMAGCPTHSYIVTALVPITREPVRHALASGREAFLAALAAECEGPPPRTPA